MMWQIQSILYKEEKLITTLCSDIRAHSCSIYVWKWICHCMGLEIDMLLLCNDGIHAIIDKWIIRFTDSSSISFWLLGYISYSHPWGDVWGTEDVDDTGRISSSQTIGSSAWLELCQQLCYSKQVVRGPLCSWWGMI